MKKERKEIYNNFISDYNKSIKSAVDQFWTLNENIEYKTTSELKSLVSKKSKKYAVLWFVKQNSEGNPGYNKSVLKSNGKVNYGVEILNYGRIEDSKINGDYIWRPNGVIFPMIYGVQKGRITPGEMAVNIDLTQKYILAYEKKGKKLGIDTFAKNIAKENCPLIKDQNIYIPSSLIFEKSDFNTMASNYNGGGEVISLSDKEYYEALESKKDRLIGISLPWTIFGRILYMRSFYNPSNGKLYSVYGTEMGEINTSKFRNAEFKSYGKCK